MLHSANLMGGPVPKYVVLFSLTADTLSRFIDNPGDRRGPVQKLAEAVGGRLESYYWMFGQYDGLAIFDMPDSQSMAALSLTVGSSGVARHVETHELIEANDLVTILGKAKSAQPSYSPPGGAAR
jgi:uncharacterized protein with GYD domain